MKTDFRKLVPAVLILAASAAAVSTNAMTRSSRMAANSAGFIQLNPQGTACQSSTMCSNIVGDLCTVSNVPGATQLWHKDADGKCLIRAYRPE